MNGRTNSLAETLEVRTLMSVSLPDALGNFEGQAVLSGGVSESVALNVTKQKGPKLSGTATLVQIAQAATFHGAINKKGIMHLTAHIGKTTGKVVATLSGDTLVGVFTIRTGKSHGAGTFSISRVTG
jgi:hypothetical protein